MNYELRLRRAAQRSLNKLQNKDYATLADVTDELQRDPKSIVHRLADSGLWRIRIGRFRLVCAIDEDAKLVTILCLTQRDKKKKHS